MTLTEARAILIDSILHVGDTTYTDAKLDRAIQWAGYRFVRDTKCNLSSTDISLSAGTAGYNPVSSITDFEIEWFVRGHISNFPVEVDDRDHVFSYLQDSAPNGRPKYVYFESETKMYVAPTPDQTYTFSVTHRAPFVSFSAGTNTPDSVTINLPVEYSHDVLWWGARAALLYGADGHEDADDAYKAFNELIVQGQKDFKSTDTGTGDRSVHPIRRTRQG